MQKILLAWSCTSQFSKTFRHANFKVRNRSHSCTRSHRELFIDGKPNLKWSTLNKVKLLQIGMSTVGNNRTLAQISSFAVWKNVSRDRLLQGKRLCGRSVLFEKNEMKSNCSWKVSRRGPKIENKGHCNQLWICILSSIK